MIWLRHMMSNNNIGFPTIQNPAVLRRLVEELNAIGDCLVVMRVGRVIGAAWSLGRLKSVAVFLPSGCRRRRATRRERKQEAHENLTETIEELHCWKVDEVGGGRDSWASYLYDKALSLRPVHCIPPFDASGKCNAMMGVVWLWRI